LIVTRPVQVEIDRQKNKGSDRLGQRARKASSLFREMLKAEHNDMVIREADPRVTMMLAINMRPDPQLENSLDYSERDDQLVGIASAYSKNFPDTEASVLTYDTGPMLSAKNVGAKWTDFPQSWLLEPETSETEKTIRKLQTQLEQARNAGPVLDLRCTDNYEPLRTVGWQMHVYGAAHAELQAWWGYWLFAVDPKAMLPCQNCLRQLCAAGTIVNCPGVLRSINSASSEFQRILRRSLREARKLEVRNGNRAAVFADLGNDTLKVAFACSLEKRSAVGASSLQSIELTSRC
jgi:hypothetical protein